LIIAVVGTICCLYAVGYIRKEVARQEIEERQTGKFFALIHLFITTMYVTVTAENLGVMWVAIEGTTIVSALLVGLPDIKRLWKQLGNILSFARLGLLLPCWGLS
jgi:hydrogenase-4 component F